MTLKWNYSGDMNLECGGFYWREPDETGTADYVEVVDVTPCSDAGGPDNLFYIESGSIFISTDPRRIESALECTSDDPATATRADIVYAIKAYAGTESNCTTILQIGKAQEPSGRGGGWSPEPTDIVRSNTNLRKYVERNFLNLG